MAAKSSSFKDFDFRAHTDVLPAVAMLGLLMLMIIPLPTFILDLLLSGSIMLAVLILLSTFFMTSPLDFSIFPTLLLITTLFRLGLNVSSTRLILLRGHEGVAAAGNIIETFGGFAVGGNYVVGMIIFVILVLINFLVITKGAGRIAEVTARFTLDAMPGKQMSIDAELNAGMIDEVEAKRRRREVTLEADFYGAMDGASKFIRGDAIAGILITLINIIGGIFIGVVQRDLAVMDAMANYTILTIGDGLVGQIPALMISTAAGILVSRVDGEAKFEDQFNIQLLKNTKLLYLVAIILGLFALIPGFRVPFGIVALATFFVARSVASNAAATATAGRKGGASGALGAAGEHKALGAGGARFGDAPERIEDLLPVDDLALEVGYELVPLVDERKNGEFLERVLRIRKQFALSMGLLVPPVHIKDNLRLASGDYVILIRGAEVARGNLKTRHFLAINPGTVTRPMKGMKTREPAFGLPALWVSERERQTAQDRGYTVVDLPTVLSTHLSEVVKKHAHEFLGRQELQTILDGVAKTHPKVIDELIPGQLDYGGILKVLQQLLKEEVSIRDMLTILEGLADFAPRTKDPEVLCELVRGRLSRSISRQYADEEGTLRYISLHPGVEEIILKGIQRTDFGSQLALEPGLAQRIVKQTGQAVETHTRGDTMPVLLSSPAVRLHLRRLTEKFLPHLAVLSHNEVASGFKLQRLGVVVLPSESRAA